MVVLDYFYPNSGIYKVIDVSLVYVIAAAVIAGVILGFSEATEVERQANNYAKRRFDIFQNTSLFGATFNRIFPLFVSFVIGAGIAVTIMRMGNVYPLSKIDRYTFVIFWFLSIACAKYLRYCYWKKKCGKL